MSFDRISHHHKIRTADPCFRAQMALEFQTSEVVKSRLILTVEELFEVSDGLSWVSGKREDETPEEWGVKLSQAMQLFLERFEEVKLRPSLGGIVLETLESNLAEWKVRWSHWKKLSDSLTPVHRTLQEHLTLFTRDELWKDMKSGQGFYDFHGPLLRERDAFFELGDKKSISSYLARAAFRRGLYLEHIASDFPELHLKLERLESELELHLLWDEELK